MQKPFLKGRKNICVAFCGFTGQIASPEEILESMKNKIIHRGPDSDGSHLDNGIAMGFRRLSFGSGGRQSAHL